MMAHVVKALMALAIISVSLGGAAQVHHVVGGGRGWDPYADLASWSSGKTFRVGDQIWFTHSAAQGTIAELKTKEEYESCDVSNPIRMYTDSTDSISLDGEGIRYFASSNSGKCKIGLKLHVDVMPEEKPDSEADADADADTSKVLTLEGSDSAVAHGPTPSGSAHLQASFALFVVGLGLSYMGF